MRRPLAGPPTARAPLRVLSRAPSTFRRFFSLQSSLLTPSPATPSPLRFADKAAARRELLQTTTDWETLLTNLATTAPSIANSVTGLVSAILQGVTGIVAASQG